MITRHLIIRRADQDHVDPKTVERDYVLAHCLSSISKLPEVAGMIFKGGTALRMCYFEQYRYSADLDFSLVNISRDEALQAIARALTSLKEDMEFSLLELSTQDQTRIVYQGPLGARNRWIKLDLDDAELVLSSGSMPILPRYEDLGSPELLPTYSLAEIGAEKLRCVIQRLQCRDFFDLHYLFEGERLDLEEVWPMFEQKAAHKRLNPAVFFERFDARVQDYKQRWDEEMREHLPGDPPHFDAMLRQLNRRLKSRR